MRKLLALVLFSIALVLACSSSANNGDLWEPVEEQYKTIQVPIINDVTNLTGGQP